MRITYERLYNGKVYQQEPPDAIKAGAEQQTASLLPSRERPALLPEVLAEERATPTLAAEPAFTLTAPLSSARGHQSSLFNGID